MRDGVGSERTRGGVSIVQTGAMAWSGKWDDEKGGRLSLDALAAFLYETEHLVEFGREQVERGQDPSVRSEVVSASSSWSSRCTHETRSRSRS